MNAEELISTYVKRDTVKVSTPELQCEHLHVRCLTLGEMKRLQDLGDDKATPASIAMALADHKGERLFSDGSLEAGMAWVEKLPANLIVRLTSAIESMMDTNAKGKAKN